jgi:hypothetical protein
MGRTGNVALQIRPDHKAQPVLPGRVLGQQGRSLVIKFERTGMIADRFGFCRFFQQFHGGLRLLLRRLRGKLDTGQQY